MMDTVTVYFDIEPELADLLNNQGITLEDIIRQVSDETDVSYGLLRLSEAGTRSKDVVPIIVASSASLAAILLALSSLLDTYYHRPHYYEWDELVELKEGEKLVLDTDGNPIYKVKRRHELLQAQQRKEKQSLEFDTALAGLVLRVNSTKE